MTNATGLVESSRMSSTLADYDSLRRSTDSYLPLRETSYSPAPSLLQLKSQFAAKRVDSTQRLYELLTRAYPSLQEEEALRLAERY